MRIRLDHRAQSRYLCMAALLAASGCTQKYLIGALPGSQPSGVADSPLIGTPVSPVAAPVPVVPPPVRTQIFDALQATQTTQKISPKTHILMVVDNSGSTSTFQAAFTQGFANFSKKYFTPDLDLSVATITTDTYLAGVSADAGYGPDAGLCYSHLVAGVHDGILPGVGDGSAAPFLPGTCQLTPSALASLQAGGTRSLRPILSTVPPDGTLATPAYIAKLVADFQKNALPGTNGDGSERGLQSLYQFIKDNERRPECASVPATDPSCFFPHYKLANNPVPPVNAVVFISDEHDQSDSDFGNASVVVHDANVIKRYTDAQMMSTSVTLAQSFKKMLDGFFAGLHEAGNPDPNYSVFSITNILCSGKCGLQAGTNLRDVNENWGIEYATLVDAFAGNDGRNGRPVQAADTANSSAKYSKLYSIKSTAYDTLFDYIGTQIMTGTKTVPVYSYALSQAVTVPGSLAATLILGDGTRIPLQPDWINASGTSVTLSAQFAALIPAQDLQAKIEVKYQ